MITETITKNEAMQRLDKYLKKRLPLADTGFLYKMLRKKNITRNGKRAEGREKLCEGDTIEFFFSEETMQKLSRQREEASWRMDPRYTVPDILYETEDLIFLNKPAGVLSQKAKEQDFSANEQLLRYLYDRQIVTEDSLAAFRPSICNRLDRNTSGILIGGKTLQGLQEAARLLKEREIIKIYHALVHGKIEESFRADARLKKDSDQNRVKVFLGPREGASQISMRISPVEGGELWTCLSIQLLTGKTHQIRAHLAALSHPIIGDPKYGDRRADERFCGQIRLSRQMLHAKSCVLPDGTEVTAPYPRDFYGMLDALRKMR